MLSSDYIDACPLICTALYSTASTLRCPDVELQPGGASEVIHQMVKSPVLWVAISISASLAQSRPDMDELLDDCGDIVAS